MRELFFILILLKLSVVQAKTIVVGPNEKITTIKSAINQARDHDTLLIKPGIYREGNIQVLKSLTIIGSKGAILDGENKYELLTISGQNIVVKNLEFRNAGYSALNDFAAIKIIDAINITIDAVQIFNSYFAIHVSNTIKCNVRNCSIQGTRTSEQLSGNGIHLWKCDSALISGNHVQGHRDGIYFEFVTSSLIENNVSENNIRYGLHFMFSHSDHYVNNTFSKNGAGVAVMYSKKVRMEKNHFQENWGPSAYGILLKEITDGYIIGNTFYKNTTGIYLEGSSRLDIEKNSFKNNGWAVRIQASCDENNFHHNNFSGNSFDVTTNGTMVLNHFYNNYWDKYTGYDINKDGIGDVPYHPVSMYSMISEQNPTLLILMRSFIVSLLDKSEEVIPSLTPEQFKDEKPYIKPVRL
jgi:nitrous oxidase accessory protein